MTSITSAKKESIIKPEYLNAVTSFKFNTLPTSFSLHVTEDDLDALVTEVSHKIIVASNLASAYFAYKQTWLDLCYYTVQNEDKSDSKRIERIQKASYQEKAILYHITRKVAEILGIKDMTNIHTPVLLFGIKSIHELTQPSTLISERDKMRKELEKLRSYKNIYSAPSSFSNTYEIKLLEKINARIKRISSLLEESSSSSSSSTVIATPIPLPITPPTTPPTITPLTSPSVTPPMTPITISLISPSTTPSITPPITPTTITTLIDSPGTPPIISSTISAASR